MIAASAGQKIGHKGTRLRNPLLVTGLGLETVDNGEVLVVVGGILLLGATVRQGVLDHLVGDVGAVGETGSLGHAGTGGRRHTVESVLLLAVLAVGGRRLVQRSAGLVVGQVGLPRVGEQGKNGGDSARRTSLAGRDHDAKVHEVIVEPAAIATKASLDNVDILPTDGILDLAAAFARGELGQDSAAGGQTENATHALHQFGVGVTTEDDNVANHVAVLILRTVGVARTLRRGRRRERDEGGGGGVGGDGVGGGGGRWIAGGDKPGKKGKQCHGSVWVVRGSYAPLAVRRWAS